MKRRAGTWLAPGLAAAILSGCTLSTGSTTEVTESAQEGAASGGSGGSGTSGGQATDRKPAQPTPSAPHVSALCDSLTAVYLTNLSDAKNAASIVNDWVRVTEAAPARLKDDLNAVGAYLIAAAKGDLTTVKAASDVVDKALDHVDRYVTKVCKA